MVDTEHRFIQFELWKDCNNHCEFCQNRGLGDVDKLESLEFVLDKLNSDEITNFNEIGFIGGEFFDTQLDDTSVHDKFFSVFDRVLELLKSGNITKVYVTSALIFKSSKYLDEFVEYVHSHHVADKFLLCTSYDTKYRFHTETKHTQWKTWMKHLHDICPELRVHTEIIMTEHFIQRVLNGEFDILSFQDEYHTRIDYIEPHTGWYYENKDEFMRNIPEFLPKRSSFIQFLNYTCVQNKLIDLDMLFNRNLKSNTFYIHYKAGEMLKFNDRRSHESRTCDLQLDHIPYWGYSDSDIDIYDDVKNLRGSLNE